MLEEFDEELLEEFEEELELELRDEFDEEFELELLEEFDEELPATTKEPSALLDALRAGWGMSIVGGLRASAGVAAKPAVPTMKAVSRLYFFMT